MSMAACARSPDMTQEAGGELPLHLRGITRWQLFRCFLYIGATGFGGVLPAALHELVRRRKWLTPEEFTEILSLCQVLPGPNVINLSVVFGQRTGGWIGALLAFVGMMLVPLVAVMSLAALYAGYADDPEVGKIVRAIAAAAAGLVSALTIRLMWPVLRRPVAVVIIVAVATAMLVLRLPLALLLAIFLPLAVAYGIWSLNDDRR